MIRYDDGCVGCPADMGCLGNACPYRHLTIYVCDKCGEDIEGDVYEAEGDHLCEDCLKARYILEV